MKKPTRRKPKPSPSPSPTRAELRELNATLEQRGTEKLAQARLRILAAASAHGVTMDDVIRNVLDEVEALTGSQIGFYHFLDADQETLSLVNWSSNTLRSMCTAEGKGRHYPVSQAGVWVDCVRARRPVIHNDYASLPHRKGMPPGHAPVVRELVAPILRRGQIMAIIGVGNKPADYDEADVDVVSYLGDLSWEIVEHKRAEEALSKEHDFINAVLDTAGALVVVLDLEGRICRFNRACQTATGYTAGEAEGRVFWDFLIPPEETQGVQRTWAALKAGDFPNQHENHWVAKDGSLRLISWANTAIVGADGKVEHVIATGLDITGRRQREERIARLTRLYAVLSRVSEAIVRIGEEAPLYQEVCRIVAEEGGFPLVWVGEVRDRQVAPVAWAGPEANYLKEVRVEVDGELGRGPTGTCICEGHPVVDFDFKTNPRMAPWREPGLRHGLRSSAAFPLRRGDAVVGALTLYASTPGAFDEEVVRLLDSLSADVSYALNAMEEERLRKQAEQAVRRLAQFPEENPYPVLRVAFDGALMYANPPARALLAALGAAADGPLPAPLARLATQAAGEASVVEGDIAVPDGRAFVWAAARPAGEEYVNLYGLDITARKRAEQALAASEERLRVQLEHMPIACILHDAEFRVTGWNPAAEQIFGYTAAEAIGQHPCDLIVPPQARGRVHEVFQRLRDGAGKVPSLNENVKKDGRTILCRWTNTPMRDAQGRVTGHLSMAEDVTERVRARQALLQSQEDMDRAQAVAHTGSWRLDVQRNVLLWSEENWRIFGLPKGTPLTYETFLSTVHPDDRAYVHEKWSAGLRGEPYDIEHRIVVGEAVKWVREKAFLEFDADGTLRGGFGITQDITARKAMEDELRRAHDELELRVLERTAELLETVRQLEAEKLVTERASALAEATAHLLRLFTERTSQKDYLDAAVALLHDWSKCRCVGIRVLQEHGRMAYAAYTGFSQEFLREEMELDTGRDVCVCTRVATGTPDGQDEPALTPGGSFAVVDAPSFVAGLTPEELARYRGVCIREGFRTIAVVPVRYRGRPMGALHLADEEAGKLSAQDIEFLESRALLIGEALHRFALEEQVLAISEEERLRVGQELHDDVGQQLTGAAYFVDILQDSLASQSRPEAADALTVRDHLSKAIARVRDLSHGLYPVRLGAGGLVAALSELAAGVSAHRGVPCTLECDGAVATGGEREAIHLYRIAQEAVNNALKHAQASAITIRLRQEKDTLRLEVHDDGVGLPADASSRKGLGLHIMQYRAENLGGRLEAFAAPGGGTLVRCLVPNLPETREQR